MDYSIKIATIISYYTRIKIEEIEKLIEIPPRPELGDYSFPCHKLSKYIKKSSIQIAEKIRESINDNSFEKVENLGPYLNFYVNKIEFKKEVISKIFKQSNLFGSSNIGKEKKIYIEYPSYNVLKDFHLGILYNTLLGKSLYRMHKNLGYNTVGVNYFRGYNNISKLDYAYKNIEIYNDLNIQFDILYYKENSRDKINYIIELLKKENFITEENKEFIVNLKSYNLPPFICSNTDEVSMYNLRYIYDYISRKNENNDFKNINVNSNNKYINFKTIFSVLELMGYNSNNNCVNVNTNNVKFIYDSMNLKIKRNLCVQDVFKEAQYRMKEMLVQNNIKVDENTFEIGRGCIIFELLKQPVERDIILNLDNIFSRSKNSTYNIFSTYLYAKSIASDLKVEHEDIIQIEMLEDDQIALIRLLNNFGIIIEKACENYKPYILAEYIEDICDELNKLCKAELSKDKAILIKATLQVIDNGLNLLGIEITY